MFKLNAFGVADTTFSTAYRCVASGEDLDGDAYLDTTENDGIGDDGDGNMDYGASGAALVAGTSPVAWPTVPGFEGFSKWLKVANGDVSESP